MQFKVPQFLEIEDKIFGPFTFKEFAYLVGGGGMCFVLYKLLGLFWGGIPILLIGGFSLLLTFYKPNDRPFINIVESFLRYNMQSKLYVWEKRKNKIDKTNKQKIEMASTKVAEPKLSSSKLRDLAWSLDVLDAKKQLGNTKNREEKEDNI
ncbi:MAG: PrgI family protein [Candidatus Paceibacterota bacterium]|jgi:hypothetical protein